MADRDESVPTNFGDRDTTTFASGARKDMKLARFSLIPPHALREVAEVYGYGAAKYDSRNWESGLPYSIVLDAAQRHINMFLSGVDIDDESTHHHLAHAVFGLLSVLEYQLTGYTEGDDRTTLRKVKPDATTPNGSGS